MPKGDPPETTAHSLPAIRKRLYEVRQLKNLTQASVASHLGLPRVSYTMLEAGKQTLAVHHLLDFSEGLGVRLDWLLTGHIPSHPGTRFVADPWELRRTAGGLSGNGPEDETGFTHQETPKSNPANAEGGQQDQGATQAAGEAREAHAPTEEAKSDYTTHDRGPVGDVTPGERDDTMKETPPEPTPRLKRQAAKKQTNAVASRLRAYQATLKGQKVKKAKNKAKPRGKAKK